MYNYKAVLWDLDDTLYSRRTATRKLLPRMLADCLYTGRSQDFLEQAADFMTAKAKRHSLFGDEAFRALLSQHPSDKPYDYALCRDYYYAHIRSCITPDAQAVEILEKLQAQGIKLAIVTNITPELLTHQHKKVAALGIGHLFDAVVYSAELGYHKPDRRIFDHAAGLLGVENKDCLFVGDDPDTDIAGAVAADMQAVWLDHWQTPHQVADHPKVHRVQTLSEYFK